MGNEIFGRPAAEGNYDLDLGTARVHYAVHRLEGGWLARGLISGRPGRLEVYRSRAPREFLLNNWQSWGPLRKMSIRGCHSGIDEVMKKYSPYVFTPVPETFKKNLVSDYLIAWPGRAAGFLTSRTAHPYFAVEGDEVAGYLEYFEAELDGTVPIETLVILEEDAGKGAGTSGGETVPGDGAGGVESLLERLADLVARENGVRIKASDPAGWSSWYQYYANLRWDDVVRNLGIARRSFPFEVFQVDDGYERDIGEWLEPKDGFRTLPELAVLIADHGFTPGIWTAPFSVSEASDLYKKRPGWFIQEAGRPKPCYKNWGKAIYALDATRDDVKAWLYETFSTLRKMGFRFFKVDFLFAAAMPGDRTKGVTPIQAYREGMAAIRTAVGDSFVLGCGAPLWPSVGLVEGMRIGEDTAPRWDSERDAFQGPNAYHALKNAITRSFLHRRLWLNDPDCLLLRESGIELRPNERELYALAAGALDNMIIESDDLGLVGERGRAILREALRLKGGRVKVSGLMEDDFYRIQSRGGPAGDFELLANLSNLSKQYESVEVPPRSCRILADCGK